MDQRQLPEGRREQLVGTMRATAKWRKQKADEFADDHVARHRSHRAMVAISYAAKLVEGLADDDPDLTWLRYVGLRPGGQVALAEESLELLSRFGMDPGAWNRGVTHPDETQVRKLLRRMSGAEARERAAQRRDQGG